MEKKKERLECYDERISYLKYSDNYDSGVFSYIDDDGNEQWTVNQNDSGIVFPTHYNNDRVKFPKTYQDYLDNINIQRSIKAMGLDVEKFWFFILYAYDLSREKTRNIIPLKDSAKMQFRNFLTALDSAFEIDKSNQFIYDKSGNPIQKKEVEIGIKINGRKKKAVINNKLALMALSGLVDNYLDTIEEGSRFTARSTTSFNRELWYNDNSGVQNFLIIGYFKELFAYLKEDLKKGKSSDFNKNLLIAEILHFMDLIEEEQINEDCIKNKLKYYKDKDLTLSVFSAYG